MNRVGRIIWRLRIWKDTLGQDLIEYALLAACLAVAVGAIIPNIAGSVSTIFAMIRSSMNSVGSQS